MNVLSDIRTDLPTPSLTLDFAVINDHYYRFLEAYPGADVFYAVKANANPDVIQYVVNHGGGLEIASLAELELSLRAGAHGDRIICSNPIKNPLFLRRMAEAGVYAVVVDSTYEVEKVAQHAPGMRVYVRLSVDNTGSVLPLAGKFGVDGVSALQLFEMARDLGLTPIGLSFHVGSQCLNPANWENAIAACGQVWREAEARGFDMHFLDLGGGFPAGHYHDSSIPTIEAIAEVVMPAIRAHIPAELDDLMVVLEPGRGLVGESGLLYTSVVGKALRGTQEWVYLDTGVFNGLMETYEGFPPVVRLLAEDAERRPLRSVTLAGPTCDSCDVVARDIELPELHIDDVLLFLDSGAYVSEYGVAFNGFPIPEVVNLNAGFIASLTPAPANAQAEAVRLIA
ncbi:MAG: type III PLP-dependent enzyme [Anaerolineae bacterium]|nr:type III PLP-dependent enzyme [Anaerolineae bacterium]